VESEIEVTFAPARAFITLLKGHHHLRIDLLFDFLDFFLNQRFAGGFKLGCSEVVDVFAEG